MRPDFVLVSPTPTNMDLAGYRRGFTDAAINLVSGLGIHRPRLLVMVSSTRVYSECDGGWVEESSPLTATDQRGMAIVDAERQFLDSGHAASVVRCGGIYGATAGRLLNKITQGRVAPAQPLRYTNRIHRDDCARFLEHLIQRSRRGETVEPVYNAVDNNPAPAHEVESWIARQLGIAIDELASTEDSRPVSHKRCRNELLGSSGFELRYPDYRAGYSEICQKRLSKLRQ
jgi:nucleoside-diphosphate-sugar epimerase